MNENFADLRSQNLPRCRPAGVALVLVLSFLVIISGLIIAFFSMVTSEASSAGTTAAATSAKTLADSAVSYVMGTIVDATLGHDPNASADNGGPANAWAWASQPGMIRDWDNTGALKFVYKLYSADSMKLSTVPPNFQDTPTNSDWASGSNKDVWVDMNEPVKDATGTEDIYPIVDPSADENFPSVVTSYSGRTDNYPLHRVEGFNVLPNGAGQDLPQINDPNTPPLDKNNNNPAPMPVKWLYVLQDGTLTTAYGGSRTGTPVTLHTATTATNPIKGRIAFWTDDESSKVNINTASEGTYWDVPRIFSAEDCGQLLTTSISPAGPQAAPGLAGLGLCQPSNGEYQRYPGHPAQTSLSKVFGFKGKSGSLQPVLPVPAITVGSAYQPQAELSIEKYYGFTPPSSTSGLPSYGLTPRLVGGGSYGGTTVNQTSLQPSANSPSQGPYWRLYASVDELLFNALDPSLQATQSGDTVHRIPNVIPTSGTSNSSNNVASAITPDMMQKSKFFITANSSGPEVTLFNTPRVSMWPINDTTNGHIAPLNGAPLKLTAFDKLAQFCTTVGYSANSSNGSVGDTTRLYPFYFTRYNARDNITDVGLGRNPLLFQYLQKLTSLPIPGNPAGSTFLSKFGPDTSNNQSFASYTKGSTDRDQLLLCIFDYVRCTNMQDNTLDPTTGLYPYKYTPSSTVQGVNGNNTTYPKGIPGGGEVVPSRMSDTKGNILQGFGRFDTIGSAYLVCFVAHALKYTTDPKAMPYVPKPPGATNLGTPDALGVVFMVSFNNVMQGNVGNHPKTKYQVEGLENLVFTAGPFLPITNQGQAVAAQPFTGGTFNGPNTAGKGLSLFPGGIGSPNGINYIETSDVRTWHGRGIGGTASPVMAFCNGLWNQSNPPNPNPKKCTRAGGSVIANYPFYGYTNTLPSPTANAAYSATTNVYYPTKFSVELVPVPTASNPKGDIKITIKTAPDYTATNNVAEIGGGADAQIVHLNFPFGVFKMPQNADAVAPTGDTTLIYSDNDRGFGTGPKTPQYQFQTFFFNNRIPAAEGGGPGDNDTNSFIRSTDTVIALEPSGTVVTGTDTVTPDHTAGDQRMYAALHEVDASYFQPDMVYGTGGSRSQFTETDLNKQAAIPVPPQMAHNMMRSVGFVDPNAATSSVGVYHGVIVNGNVNLGKLINVGSTTYSPAIFSRWADVPRRAANYVTRSDGGPGSWDTGMGMHKDGAYINKPDEGDQNFYRADLASPAYRVPYIDKEDYFANAQAFFSPNRQIPSSMMFGSMPTGIQRHLPWQTLLFHPALSDTSNPEAIVPPADHYLADLFWMPVVEPYAISQPFSTAGKINMNYQIQPFTYIRRTTAMRALMSSTKMLAVSPTVAAGYKPDFGDSTNGAKVPGARFPLQMDCTMTMFDKKFSTGDIYRSATEISTIPLIPNDPNLGFSGSEQYTTLLNAITGYWGSGTSPLAKHQLTGNNLRDKPYADLYGRLTTKSNTFTVHVRAQALRKSSTTDPSQWVSGKDQVIAEYRGSSLIERYIDANDPNLPDFAQITVNDATSAALNIDQYYKFRVVSSKRFAP